MGNVFGSSSEPPQEEQGSQNPTVVHATPGVNNRRRNIGTSRSGNNVASPPNPGNNRAASNSSSVAPPPNPGNNGAASKSVAASPKNGNISTTLSNLLGNSQPTQTQQGGKKKRVYKKTKKSSSIKKKSSKKSTSSSKRRSSKK